METKPKADPAGRWLAIVTAVAAGIGVPGLALQLRHARKASRDERTAAFAARYSAREFQDVVSPALSFLRVQDVSECLTKLEAHERRRHAAEQCLPRARDRPDGPRASVNDLFQVFYFFEDLAAGYNRNEVTRRKLHETLPGPPVQFFTEGWWYICWLRAGEWVGPEPWRRTPQWLRRESKTDLYAQFEWMVLALRQRVRSEREEDASVESLMVLCLPPARDRRLGSAWRRARHYSETLSAHPEKLDPLVKKLEAAARPGSGAASWQVVIVPPSIEVDKAENDRRLWIAERLARCLDLLDQATVEAEVRALR